MFSSRVEKNMSNNFDFDGKIWKRRSLSWSQLREEFLDKEFGHFSNLQVSNSIRHYRAGIRKIIQTVECRRWGHTWLGENISHYQERYSCIRLILMVAAAALISDFHRLIPSIKIWPWWWSDGQRARLLLRQPEFESRWVYNFYSVKLFEKDKNKFKRPRMDQFFKKMVKTESTFRW